MTRARLALIGWAGGLVLVLMALAWQVQYAWDSAACSLDERLGLCSGPLDSWVLAVTLGIGLALLAIGAWRLARRH